jgi:hypothetical protein
LEELVAAPVKKTEIETTFEIVFQWKNDWYSIQNSSMEKKTANVLRHKCNTLNYHGRYGEVTAVHVLSQPIHFTTSVAEDHGLSDTQRIVQITQRFQLPIFPLNKYKELLDTYKQNCHKFQWLDSSKC